MVKTYNKIVLRQIKQNKARFISLILILLLGVGFITGLLVIRPTMEKNITRYYNDYNISDIIIKGMFNKEDNNIINELKNNENIKEYSFSNTYDDDIIFNNEKLHSRIIINDLKINNVNILEGRYPKNENEILVQKKGNYFKDIKLNDKIAYNNKELDVVGIIISPLNMANEKETDYNNNKLDTIIYLNSEYFTDLNIYTNINIIFKNSNKYNIFSKSYEDFIYNNLTNLKISNNNDDINNYNIIKRSDNLGYQLIKENLIKIDSIVKIFPILFLIVVTLVVLSTMTRMVEEERLELGILRSLGFSKKKITFKYLLYIIIALLIAIIFGNLMGLTIFPSIVYNTFKTLYYLPKLRFIVDLSYGIYTSLIIMFFVLISTFYTTHKLLKNNPSTLLIEKAPKPGKRILLEKIKFIWNKLKFKYKASYRNIFRYKKHLYMTILGIMGCSSLIFAGFGLDESIKSVYNIQYQKIIEYDGMINNYNGQNLDDILDKNNYIKVYKENLTLNINDEKIDIILIVSNNLDKYFNLYDLDDHKVILNSDGIYLTKRIHDITNLNKNDYFNLLNKDLKINNIIQNYVDNYTFMTKDFYLKNINDNLKDNTILYKSDKSNDLIKEELLNLNLSNIEFISEVSSQNQRLLNQVSQIVVLVILTGFALAVLVIYNLTYVNISEREKELATLKVLGYKKFEVSFYIYRETFILTIMGLLFGLVTGIFIHRYIISSIDSNYMIFKPNLSWYVYFSTIILTIFFTILVDFLMYFKINKIKMTSSLY